MSVQVVDSQYLSVVNEAHRVLVFKLHEQSGELQVSECDYFEVINIEWTIKFSQTQLMHVWERGELVGFPTRATPPTAVQ